MPPLTARSPRSLAAALAMLLLTALGTAACTGGSGGGDDEPAASADHTGREGDGWTVLHYSMADTNLEPFMVTDVNELGAVGSNDNLQVREFMDRSAGYGEDELLDQGSWVGARVLDLGADGSTEVVEDLGDVDSADPEVLATFIADGIEAHRAGHYALVISDHGSSWPGIGPDEGSDWDVLDLAEITDAIATGLERAGVDKLDLLGFDACLMANFEVASAVAPLADRLVASQELEPGHGWDYGALQLLAEDPDATADDLGEEILAGFADQAAAEGTADQITLALIDLTRMAAVDEAVAGFAAALTEESTDVAPAVGQSEASTLAFGKSPDETQDKHLSDLGQLAAAIGEAAPEVADQADAVVTALDEAVLETVDGVGTAGATGLSIYLPPVADLADPAYLDVASSADWADFLDAYYSAGAAIPAAEQPEFTDPADGPDVSFDHDGSITLTGTFDPAALDNITEATISYALVNDDDSITYLGEEIADFDDSGSTPEASGNYDLTVLQLDDGEDSAYAYVELDLSDDLGTAFFDVPLTYYASTDPEGTDPQDALLSLVLDIESGAFVSETIYLYDEQSGGYGELAPDPEGIIVPDVLTIGADGEQTWEPTTDVGLYADVANLTYEFVPLDRGTVIQADLTLYDFGGNTSTLSSLVEVP
ncbi:clostripain-related cysteine peptidase [Nocardioides sp.]|uniref:clostripain-related cysteine peptidase n=1 Tax=Nocardioides sp. TaxID=35761 RepID=UPI0026319D33|nr:clostripain-related cysteine peptidase [Nocardioides sp.]MDI6910852.1 clostripain-related cysteine peptidase [Nocardioides sp.]